MHLHRSNVDSLNECILNNFFKHQCESNLPFHWDSNSVVLIRNNRPHLQLFQVFLVLKTSQVSLKENCFDKI